LDQVISGAPTKKSLRGSELKLSEKLFSAGALLPQVEPETILANLADETISKEEALSTTRRGVVRQFAGIHNFPLSMNVPGLPKDLEQAKPLRSEKFDQMVKSFTKVMRGTLEPSQIKGSLPDIADLIMEGAHARNYKFDYADKKLLNDILGLRTRKPDAPKAQMPTNTQKGPSLEVTSPFKEKISGVFDKEFEGAPRQKKRSFRERLEASNREKFETQKTEELETSQKEAAKRKADLRRSVDQLKPAVKPFELPVKSPELTGEIKNITREKKQREAAETGLGKKPKPPVFNAKEFSLPPERPSSKYKVIIEEDGTRRKVKAMEWDMDALRQESAKRFPRPKTSPTPREIHSPRRPMAPRPADVPPPVESRTTRPVPVTKPKPSSGRGGIPIPQPTYTESKYPKPPELGRLAKATKKASEVFFDIENTIAREQSGSTGRILQFAAKRLEGDLMTSSIRGDKLGVNELGKEISKRIQGGKATFFKSSLLDISSAETMSKMLEKGGVEDLVSAGFLGERDVSKVQAMARSASSETNPLTTRKFLQRELSEYLSGTTRVVERAGGETERVFTSAYKKQLPFMPVTKNLGDWFRHEEAMLRNVSDYFDTLSKTEGHHQLVGHNIERHDIPILKERARYHGINMLNNMNNFEVVDTLKSTSSMQMSFNESIEDYKRTGPARAATITKDKIRSGGRLSGIKSLENIVQAYGIASKETVSLYEHTSALHDTNMSIGASIAVERADKPTTRRALMQYQQMSQESMNALDSAASGGKARTLSIVPQANQVSPAVKQMMSGEAQSMLEGVRNPTSIHYAQAPTPIAPARSTTSMLAGAVDNIYGQGTSKEARQIAKSTMQIADTVMSSVGPKLDTFGARVDDFFTQIGVKSKSPIRGQAFMGLGLLGVAAGAGIMMASAPFQSGAPNRPIRVNKPIRSMSADDQEHRIRTPGGAMAEGMRHALTDFGSGYKGFVGSALGHLRGNIMSRSNLARKVVSGAGQAEAHFATSATKPSQAMAKAGITRPIERHGQVVMNPRPPKQPQSVEFQSGGNKTLKASKESQGYQACEITKKKQALARKKRFVELSSQGSAPVFISNHKRIGHRQM
jgi:hypothetical protein